MASLIAEGLGVAYADEYAVRDVDLVVYPGSFTAVTGPSGAGKTSLLWALAGALSPATGTVTFDDEPLRSRAHAAAQGVALIPQGNGLVTSLTTLENVLLPLMRSGEPAPQVRQRSVEFLRLVGLHEHLNHHRGAVGRAAAADRDRARPRLLAQGSAGGRAHERPRLDEQGARARTCFEPRLGAARSSSWPPMIPTPLPPPITSPPTRCRSNGLVTRVPSVRSG